MLSCFVLPSPQETITTSLSARTSHIRVVVDILVPYPFPLCLSFVYFHSPLCFIITRSHTFITGFPWPAYTIFHFLSWCTGTLQMQLNLLRYCSFWLTYPSFRVERFLILPLIPVLSRLSAVSGLMQKCCIN